MTNTKVGNATNANFPVDDDGVVYHLGVARDGLAPRVLTVGDYGRAEKLRDKLLDANTKVTTTQHRGFHIHTGTYKGVRVSIVSIGMGTPMMDFLVREGRFVGVGPMAIVRYGTCGSLRDVPVGSLAIAKDCVLIRRNPDHWHPAAAAAGDVKPYDISLPWEGDSELISKLTDAFKTEIPDRKVIVGTNATADSFYSSQGRQDSNFDDHNQDLIDQILKRYPEASTLEMESFQLYHMAARSIAVPIKAAAATIILANRIDNTFLDNDTKVKLEVEGGRACLEALIKIDL
ncbi:uridine phosphorylase [Heterostelium album PN500]|uniref:Uridine phosphorylase n=1 Tax=Heterostelium pallidum (strain ATCC 26659 / Pp 5 / PN500) TaxID=670386 RepID=D3BC50_HETP5|nr:uridine phosphorylase [Heterostelium album PN500]EFA81233.1 uridine phosphorylase [Heterostelium album PN500]|eukprot:XP_020433351.1 uridine phosphorylase [Heterostelium album PN500]